MRFDTEAVSNCDCGNAEINDIPAVNGANVRSGVIASIVTELLNTIEEYREEHVTEWTKYEIAEDEVGEAMQEGIVEAYDIALAAIRDTFKDFI